MPSILSQLDSGETLKNLLERKKPKPLQFFRSLIKFCREVSYDSQVSWGKTAGSLDSQTSKIACPFGPN